MDTIKMIQATIFGAAALFGGCASTNNSRDDRGFVAATPDRHDDNMRKMAGMCPMQVKGATVTPLDVQDGVSLAFTTQTGDVAQLRERVRNMAQMHAENHDVGQIHEHGGDPSHDHKSMTESEGMNMPPSTASVENIDNGARLVLRPIAPAQLSALRQHVWRHAEHMANDKCAMKDREAPHAAQ